MQRLSSIFLLLVFTTIIFPRVAWHDCSHAEESVEASGETIISEASCDICSFHFSSFQTPATCTAESPQQAIAVEDASHIPFFSSFFTGLSSGRAPPFSL